jgi:hypothetical protein
MHCAGCIGIRLYQVAGAANTRPIRWARMVSRPVGTCRNSGNSTIEYGRAGHRAHAGEQLPEEDSWHRALPP